jgi:hypothetical protein
MKAVLHWGQSLSATARVLWFVAGAVAVVWVGLLLIGLLTAAM